MHLLRLCWAIARFLSRLSLVVPVKLRASNLRFHLCGSARYKEINCQHNTSRLHWESSTTRISMVSHFFHVASICVQKNMHLICMRAYNKQAIFLYYMGLRMTNGVQLVLFYLLVWFWGIRMRRLERAHLQRTAACSLHHAWVYIISISFPFSARRIFVLWTF